MDPAESDLDDIWEYIAADSPLDASRYVDRIVERFELIASSPKMAPLRPDFGPGLRAHPVDRYLIVYRFNSTTLTILRIVRGDRNLKIVFKDFDG